MKKKKNKNIDDEKVIGQESGSDIAEKLLALILFPFKLACRIIWKLFKMIVKSVILAPFTIIIYIAIIVIAILYFV